jgi:hypothetical protein
VCSKAGFEAVKAWLAAEVLLDGTGSMAEGNGQADDGMMRIGKRCYVSNLAWRTSWQDLKDKFRECGTVVYANVTRGEDGKCRS